MTPEEQVFIVEKICSDPQLFADFLSKIAGYLYIDTGSISMRTNFSTIIKNKAIDGKFTYKVK